MLVGALVDAAVLGALVLVGTGGAAVLGDFMLGDVGLGDVGAGAVVTARAFRVEQADSRRAAVRVRTAALLRLVGRPR